MSVPPTIHIEEVPLDSLRPDPFNPRRISDAELEALTRSIQKYGFVQPVVARREDRTIIGGHQRGLAARKLGYKTVPVIFLDLSIDEARVLNLGLNKISGEFDTELLARMLADLSVSVDIDMSLTGFAEDEIGAYLRRLDSREKKERVEHFDFEEAIKATQAATRAQPGQIWIMGAHRIMVGDSTNSADVARLMHGETAALMATDPPYLVDYDSGDRVAGKSKKPRASKQWDEYKDAETSIAFFGDYLRAALPHLAANAAIYQWHASIRQHLVMKAWEDCGLHLHQTVIWVKPSGVLSRSHFMWQHEPCFYGWVEGQQPKRKPPAKCTTVWQVTGEQDNLHLTQKPLELFTRPMEYHTVSGDVCFEPFSGSGTQIIAAERLGRRCFAMELEPRFADVAILRWESFSGETARLEEAG